MAEPAASPVVRARRADGVDRAEQAHRDGGPDRASWRGLTASSIETLRRWPWLDTLHVLRQRFREDRLGVTASSLTFTTLIAMVPLLTVMLAVFTAFPMFSSIQGALETYFLQNLVPDGIARPVMRAMTTFASNAAKVGAAGLGVLVATALALMLTFDRTLNAIWRVKRARPFGQRVLVYWASLTLGPLLLGASLAATSWAISASKGLVTALPGGVGLLFDIVQFALLATATAGLFHYVPNTHVRWSHAWAGALFVAFAFEGAKVGLAWYVSAVPTYTSVYGAFATGPILLLWIYLVWVIVLLGAVIAAYAPTLSMHVMLRPPAPGQHFETALAVLAALDTARHTEHHGLALEALAVQLRIDPLQIEPLLETLVELGWVGRLEEPGSPRHVLLAEPAITRVEPLVDRLLLEPSVRVQSFRRRAALAEMTLADVLG